MDKHKINIDNYLENNCIRVELLVNFGHIKSTLGRTGTINRLRNTLIPSCYILHKQGCYYIVHFKQLRFLDIGITSYNENDKARLIKIAKIIESFNMIKILNNPVVTNVNDENINVTIIKANDVNNGKWQIKHKHNIGVGDDTK